MALFRGEAAENDGAAAAGSSSSSVAAAVQVDRTATAPCHSTAPAANIFVRHSSTRGSQIIAAGDLRPGTLVLHPACAAEAMLSTEHCDRCKRRVDASALCAKCGVHALCDVCRSDGLLVAAHALECRAFNELAMHWDAFKSDEARDGADLVFRSTSVQLLRLLLRWAIHVRHGDHSLLYDSGCDTFVGSISVANLLTHAEQRDEADVESIRHTSAFLHRIVQRCSPNEQLPRVSAGPTVEELSTMLQICRVNTMSIMDPVSQVVTGIGLYPSGAMINHSCTPNCDYLPGHDGEMRLVTIGSVCAGDELTIQYCDVLTTATDERQHVLESEYFFRCDCARCVRADQTFDRLLTESDDAQHEKHLARLHEKATNADDIQLFHQAMKMQGSLQPLHRLHYTSADGVLLHCGPTPDEAKYVVDAATRILAFHEECARHAPAHTELLTGTIAPLLKLARAAHLLRREPDWRVAVQRAVNLLRPFEFDVSGLEAWLADPSTVDESVSLEDIVWSS